LRLLYRSEEARDILVKREVRHLLPSIAHLAHKFNVGWLVVQVEVALCKRVELPTELADKDTPCTLRELVSYSQLADSPLDFKKLRASTVLAIARRLGSSRVTGEVQGGAFIEAALLAGLSGSALSFVLGAVLAAVRAAPIEARVAVEQGLPHVWECNEWTKLQGESDEFTWGTSGFSLELSEEDPLVTHRFWIAGHTWRLALFELGGQLLLKLLWLPGSSRSSGLYMAARATLLHPDRPSKSVGDAMLEPKQFWHSRGRSSDEEDGGRAEVVAATFTLGPAAYGLDAGHGFLVDGLLRIHFEMVH
jgi:hypothetical protein